LPLDDELISTNPTTGITKRLFPKNSGKKKAVEKAEVFTKEEHNLFLEICESNYIK
jgi:ribosomal protein L23